MWTLAQQLCQWQCKKVIRKYLLKKNYFFSLTKKMKLLGDWACLQFTCVALRTCLLSCFGVRYPQRQIIGSNCKYQHTDNFMQLFTHIHQEKAALCWCPLLENKETKYQKNLICGTWTHLSQRADKKNEYTHNAVKVKFVNKSL